MTLNRNKKVLDSLQIAPRWWVPFMIGTAHGACVVFVFNESPISVMLSYGILGVTGATFLYHKAVKDVALFLWDMRPLWL